jgi:putative Mn2+ efflux pump MntP
MTPGFALSFRATLTIAVARTLDSVAVGLTAGLVGRTT